MIYKSEWKILRSNDSQEKEAKMTDEVEEFGGLSTNGCLWFCLGFSPVVGVSASPDRVTNAA